MSLAERIALATLHRLDPERAHTLALMALRTGLAPAPGPVTSSRLATRVGGLDLLNPVGLAAGFDKNAQAVRPLSRAGFGWIELGAATPRAQPGNPKPRLFRLPEDGAVINRFGFNNDGVAAIARRIAPPSEIPKGLNLGANKDSQDKAADFAAVLSQAGDYVDFATVNVSSPNTEKLRDLQGEAALTALLDGVMAANARLARPLPIFLKIAPDLDRDGVAQIVRAAERTGVSAIIATNTTLSRDGLRSRNKDEAGGLSGTPLFERSTRVLAQLSQLTLLPLIGVGGIASAEDAYTKIKAGASAVQLYSALAYHGLSLVPRIARGLDDLLTRDGLTVSQAVGIESDRWIS